MELREITFNLKDYQLQLAHVMRLQFAHDLQKIKSSILFLILWLILFIIVLNTSGSSAWVTLKAISSGLTAFIVLYTSIKVAPSLMKYFQRRSVVKNLSKNQMERLLNEKHFMAFDENGITTANTVAKSELKWGYFQQWDEHEGSLFIIVSQHLDLTICCSKQEIGEPAYHELKSLLTQKLRRLDSNVT